MVRFDGIHLALCLALIRVVAWAITPQSHVSGRTNPVDMGDAGRTAALNGAEASQCSEDDVLRQLAKHRVQALELFERHDDGTGESLNHIATQPQRHSKPHVARAYHRAEELRRQLLPTVGQQSCGCKGCQGLMFLWRARVAVGVVTQ